MKDFNPTTVVIIVYFVIIAGFIFDWLVKRLWR